MWNTESEAENDSEAELQFELGFVELKLGSDLAESLASTEHVFQIETLVELGFETEPLTEDGNEPGPEPGFEAGSWTGDGFETGFVFVALGRGA